LETLADIYIFSSRARAVILHEPPHGGAAGILSLFSYLLLAKKDV